MDGVLLVHKEANMTSFDVVNQLRRIYGTKKIGHTGTLDPQATGVLVCLIGKATKILPYLQTQQKEYIAEMVLGMDTDTKDIWGVTLQQSEVVPYTQSQLDAVLKSFVGPQSQIPPMVSAIKKDGKKLYEYHREGIEIQRDSRPIEIFALEQLDAQERIRFRVQCTAGTYIRVLCEDIARKLGNIGVMSSLVRTKVDRYLLKDAHTLSELKENPDVLLSTYEVLSAILPCVEYENMEDVRNGKRIHLENKQELVLIVENKECVAVYGKTTDDLYASVRGLW